MRIIVYSVILISFIAQSAKAQVGINTTEPKATFHIEVKDPDEPDSSAGILVPRVTQNPASGNEKGQLIFNKTDNQFYFWDGAKWAPIVSNTGITMAGTSYFTDTKDSMPITLDQNSSETLVPQTAIEFSLAREQEVQFTSTVNFKGRSAAFAPLFKLKLTKTDTSTEEIIDKASNTFLSDGIADYYGNLQLLSIKRIPAGNYKAEIVAYYNNCCDFNFIYEVGGAETPVSLLIQYK
ncbi:hypothetical protein [Ornithobacterium rhinotracheale]|uniref:hypothetical protein n=1 Tax=Ornithobacterium rhinotracheale TaxID=28251 RepID=UPI001FF5728D|nr:hypothetical protein [Ornithobacterium rhinotracheale]MCK0204787.1 hypothetical protein [Ornithobacterium rhinotracheale]